MDHIWIDFIMWIIQSKFDAKQWRWRWWMDAHAHTVGSLFSYLFFSYPCRPFLLELQKVNDQIDFSNEMDTMYGKLIRFKNTHIETKSTNQQNDTGCFWGFSDSLSIQKKICINWQFYRLLCLFVVLVFLHYGQMFA